MKNSTLPKLTSQGVGSGHVAGGLRAAQEHVLDRANVRPCLLWTWHPGGTGNAGLAFAFNHIEEEEAADIPESACSTCSFPYLTGGEIGRTML